MLQDLIVVFKHLLSIRFDKAISEQSIEEEEIKDPTAISKTMSCRKPIKHKNTLMSNGVVSH